MGTIFKHNGKLIQCKSLQKKLKKLKITEADIEIVKDNIPEESLEKEFVLLERGEKILEDTDACWIHYIFQNSKGYYLLGINYPNIDYIKAFGFDISDYKLIKVCKGDPSSEYTKWNPETKTGKK